MTIWIIKGLSDISCGIIKDTNNSHLTNQKQLHAKVSHTGLLIQRMSALSVSVSSGPKSVMGWASTRELCFLFSMLGLAVL